MVHIYWYQLVGCVVVVVCCHVADDVALLLRFLKTGIGVARLIIIVSPSDREGSNFTSGWLSLSIWSTSILGPSLIMPVVVPPSPLGEITSLVFDGSTSDTAIAAGVCPAGEGMRFSSLIPSSPF